MHVLELWAKNYCQHADRHEVLEAGLIAFIGPNGSGKSNYFGIIRYALTGKIDNAGTLSANVFDRAGTGEHSNVRLRFSHGDVIATVQRNIRPVKPAAVLEIETTGERFEGAEVVNAKIAEIIGISFDVLNEMVIVAQDDIFGFLDKTPAARAAAFQKLFNTEKALELYKLMGEHLRDKGVPTVVTNIEDLNREITANQENLLQRQGTLSTMSTYEQLNAVKDSYNAAIANFNQRMVVIGELDRGGQRMAQLEGELAGHTAERQRLHGLLTRMQSELVGKTELSASARQVLQDLSAWRHNQASRAQFQQQHDAAVAEQAALALPCPPMNFIAAESFAAAQAEMAKLGSDKGAVDRLLNSFAAGATECPTCGAPSNSVERAVQNARAELPILHNKIVQLSSAMTATNAFNEQMRAYTAKAQYLNDRITSLQATLDALPAAQAVSGDEATLRATVEDQKNCEEGVRQLTASLSTIDQALARVQGSIAEGQTYMNERTQRLAALPVCTAQDRDNASLQLANVQTLEGQRRMLEQDIAVLQNNITNAQQNAANHIATVARIEKLRTWNEYVGGMRGLVHTDAAPKFVSQKNLEELQGSVNEILSLFQADFQVASDERLSFDAIFASGSKQPAERLSGGQRVILALSFRIAVNSMFADNIGALYLDEPTAALDEHYIRGFEPALERLREYSSARGMQVIIITHERGLAHLFDQVVQFGNAA